jgi:hypothetical protein
MMTDREVICRAVAGFIMASLFFLYVFGGRLF